MDTQPQPIQADPEETPESLLDTLRSHPEWDEARRDEVVERLVARFPAERLMAAVQPRLRDLRGADGECLLRLVEAYGGPEALHALAESLGEQPGLAPDRTWVALELLDGGGVLDAYPELQALWDELNESFADEGESSLEQLAEQIERDPEEAWIALQALSAVEPEIRVEIVQGLRQAPLGPGLIDFLRLLCFSHDPSTKSAALDTLESFGTDDPRLVAAWEQVASDHPDPEVSGRARRLVGARTALALSPTSILERPAPVIVRSLVTALDGEGQGTILLSAGKGSSRVTAGFLCDIRRGICDVYGQVDEEWAADQTFDELARQADRDVLHDAHALALRLLSGSLLLCGPETSPALRYWLEKTVGPSFRACPFPQAFPRWDPAELDFEEAAERLDSLLASCPTWIDASPLTYEIAEELLLRQGEVPPDPRRDAGAYRFLFERRLSSQLDLYRRMLLWMASFWEATGDDDLGRTALAISWQLSDAANAVPSHPFTVALATRSLAAAQADLRRGIDPRRP